MSLIDRVMNRLDDLTDQIAENKVEILRAIQDCPRGVKHEEQILLLKEWKDQLAGKIAGIVLICSIGGSGIVFAIIDFIKWKAGSPLP